MPKASSLHFAGIWGILSPVDCAAVQCSWLEWDPFVELVCAFSPRFVSPGDGRNKEMRSVLCLAVVCLFATTAAAQFGKVGAVPRTTTPPADAAAKKTTNEKAHPGKAAPAADQAGADADLADALLIAMDTDHDGIVTKIEYREAMK